MDWTLSFEVLSQKSNLWSYPATYLEELLDPIIHNLA